MDKNKRGKPVDEIVGERLLKKIVIKKSGLYFCGDNPGRIELAAVGETGDTGRPPKHEFDGAKIRFENPDGSWGQWVNLAGAAGAVGREGRIGQIGAVGAVGAAGEDACTSTELMLLVSDIASLKARVKKLEK